MAVYTVKSRISEIDHFALLPGDIVDVPWRPEPYCERFVVSRPGVWVRGVPGPDGQLPVISGAGAVTDRQYDLSGSWDPYLEPNSLVMVCTTERGGSAIPTGVRISNLEIRGATAGNFYQGLDGVQRPWGDSAAGLFLYTFDGLTLDNVWVTDCHQGVFTSDTRPCSKLALRNSRVWGCGREKSMYEHGLYLQSAGTVVEGCWLGPMRPGAQGNTFKDRSTGLRVRRNTIYAGGRLLDLSAPQGETALRYAVEDPAHTVIDSNVLVNRTGGPFVYIEGRLGGDDIEFTGNTLVQRVDQSASYYVRAFFAEYSDAARVRAAGNLFDGGPATAGARGADLRIWDSRGKLALGANWSRGRLNETNSWKAADSVTGLANVVVGGAKPLYVDEAAGDFRLAAGSPGAGFGVGSTAPAPPPVVPPVVVPPPPPVAPPVSPPPPPPPVVVPTWQDVQVLSTFEFGGGQRLVTTLQQLK